MSRPTIHVTNWSSRKLHGPGRRLSIMAKPRRWEHGDGRVRCLMPLVLDLDLVRAGQITVAQYRRRFEDGLPSLERLAPGRLALIPEGDEGLTIPPSTEPVRDGDTLLCACSREAAAKGECHRVWVAEALARAGWRVVLDGAEVMP